MPSGQLSSKGFEVDHYGSFKFNFKGPVIAQNIYPRHKAGQKTLLWTYADLWSRFYFNVHEAGEIVLTTLVTGAPEPGMIRSTRVSLDGEGVVPIVTETDEGGFRLQVRKRTKGGSIALGVFTPSPRQRLYRNADWFGIEIEGFEFRLCRT